MSHDDPVTTSALSREAMLEAGRERINRELDALRGVTKPAKAHAGEQARLKDEYDTGCERVRETIVRPAIAAADAEIGAWVRPLADALRKLDRAKSATYEAVVALDCPDSEKGFRGSVVESMFAGARANHAGLHDVLRLLAGFAAAAEPAKSPKLRKPRRKSR